MDSNLTCVTEHQKHPLGKCPGPARKAREVPTLEPKPQQDQISDDEGRKLKTCNIFYILFLGFYCD